MTLVSNRIDQVHYLETHCKTNTIGIIYRINLEAHNFEDINLEAHNFEFLVRLLK